MCRFPAAIVEIVRRETQRVATFRVLGWIVVAIPRNLGLKARAADHPCCVIDDAAMMTFARDVDHAIALFLGEWPAGEHALPGWWDETLLRVTLLDFADVKRP